MVQYRFVRASVGGLLILIVIFLSAQCTKEETQPVRIGYFGSLTGKNSTPGTSARDGAILAIEDYNATGGINGRPIVLVTKDDRGDSDIAEIVAMEFADDGIRYIIGPLLTSSGTKVVPIINERKILTISGTIMGDNLENIDDYFIKLNPSTRAYGFEIGGFLIREGYTKPGFIADTNNDPYCKTFQAGYLKAFEDLDVVLSTVEYDGSEKVSYSKIAAKIQSVGPDAVLICASAMDTALLAQHLKRISNDAFLISSPWGISKELIWNGGDAVEEMHFYLSIRYGDSSSRTREFGEKFQSRFRQEPSFQAMFNFEAATMLVEALRAGPVDDPVRIREIILNKTSHRGVQMDFSLDREGDPIRPLYLHKVQDGAFVPLENP